MLYYSAQIHLRKVLNRIHHDLYDTKIKQLPDKILEVLRLNLDDWKKSLPDQMRWQDEDGPSEDINAARLCAKYYGARYIIYRSVLERALHPKSPSAERQRETENVTKLLPLFTAHDFQTLNMARRSIQPVLRPNCREIDGFTDSLHYEELDDDTRRACQKCIQAAIQSTKAFHNIRDRPIVTNIFGTAHAQVHSFPRCVLYN